MHAAGASDSSWVNDNSGRITRVGRFLRWSHLDELPQMINILRGEMNLVGPRPHPVSNLALFSAAIPFYSLRAAIRPGVTGWAQVRYRYANTLQEESEKMRYDLYYIKHRSLWLDLLILARTARVLLMGLAPATLPIAAVVATPEPHAVRTT
jgi:lipopolysaccharide/colanic/teichoic acid biosynthesis glycosyltransferase